jgi:hypothetical protein
MKTLLLLHLCLLSFHAPAQDANKWEFKSEKDGCKIYHQHTEGLLHIKLATSFKVPLSGIALLFSEVESYTQWGYKMVESRLLRRVSDTELYYYARYDFPWPISDKDIILHSKLSQNPATGVLTIVNTPQPDYLPVKKGIERIRNTTTRWQFTKGNGGWVYTEQLISTDSAEGLPDWLVKLTADTGPRETAGNIRKMLSQERFQKATLAHIREH